MKSIYLAGAVLLLAVTGCAQQSATATPPVVVTPVMSTMVTATGQPIVLPQKDVQLSVSTYDIAPGAKLPVHKHPYPRYAYVLAGTLQVFYLDAGTDHIYKKGDVIVEVVDQWHKAANIGSDAVKLLVIDMAPKGAETVIKQ